MNTLPGYDELPRTSNLSALIAMLLLISASKFSHCVAQGSLTPPGAPVPTMESLDQIEARTAITNTSSLVTISQPGSYYLTRNLTVNTGDGIDINTNNLTLDLNGFTVSSTAASVTGNAISLNSGLRNITIANGFIQGGVTNNGSGVYNGGAFANGIYFSVSAPVNVLESRLSVSGGQNNGIVLGLDDSTVVEGCTARMVGGLGISGFTVKSCVAVDCGNYAIHGDQISDCRGQSVSGYGITATTVRNCSGYSSSGIGITALTALTCYGSGNSYGLAATTLQNCYGKSAGSGYGLYASETASNCYGLSVSGTGWYAFIANSCSGTSLDVTHNLNSY